MRFGLALAFLAGSAQADEAEDAFVHANVLAIFYHELGHAVIDLEEVPIFGQEEDAADVFSIFLIDALYDEDTALDLAYDAASGLWGEVVLRERDGGGIAWWDVHGPDEQRFYNTVCLFYGADPDGREEFALDMDLPEDRAVTCEEEYDLASTSWGAVLDRLQTPGGALTEFVPGPDSLANEVLAEEVAWINDTLSFSAPLTVRLDRCGEANAFYDPERSEIVVCTEFEPDLREMYRSFDA